MIVSETLLILHFHLLKSTLQNNNDSEYRNRKYNAEASEVHFKELPSIQQAEMLEKRWKGKKWIKERKTGQKDEATLRVFLITTANNCQFLVWVYFHTSLSLFILAAFRMHSKCLIWSFHQDLCKAPGLRMIHLSHYLINLSLYKWHIQLL